MFRKSPPRIIFAIAVAVPFLLTSPLIATGSQMSEAKILKPDGGMPMWYYRVARQFRYAIPTNFDFAYIDTSGKTVISGAYNLAGDFSNKVAVVKIGPQQLRNGQLEKGPRSLQISIPALINESGGIAHLSNMEMTGQFHDELAVAHFNRPEPGKPYSPHYDLIDKDGKRVSNFHWEGAKDFSEGLVAVKSDKPGSRHMEGTWGYRDKTNKEVIPAKFGTAERFSEGLAAVSVNGPNYMITSDGPAAYHPDSLSYIDKSGKVVITGPFMEAQPFHNGFAAVMQKGKWGYIDKNGRLAIPCQYDWAGNFGSRLAPVEKDLRVGFIDTTGKTVIPFQFLDAREFANGLAPATLDAKKWGYIDETGSFKIEPQFQRAFTFSNGRALVYKDVQSGPVTAVSDPVALMQAANGARNGGQMNEARAACNAVIKAAPNSKSAKEASHLLKVALPDHDTTTEVQSMYRDGIILLSSGRFKEADTLFQKLLKADPKFFPAAGAWSFGLMAQKRQQEGIKLLSETLTQSPNYARGYWRLGQLYQANGQQDLANKNFAKAKELDPDDREYMQ